MELDTQHPSSVSNLNIGNGLSLLASLSTANSINSTISSVVNNYPSSNSNSGLGGGYHSISSHYNTSGGEIKMGSEEAPSLHQNEGGSKTDMEHLRPDMVPITVRSEIPQLKEITIEKVLCGTGQTWDEFLRLFHVTLDPNLHIVKGSGGRKANLLDKVGDYVKILKRRMKVYLVNIELVHPAKKMSKSSNSSVTSSNAAAANAPSTSTKKSKNNGATTSSTNVKDPKRDSSSSKRKSKKPKWVDTSEELLPKSSQDSIENPEKSLSMETQVFSNDGTSTGLTKSGKERKKRQSRKNSKPAANNGHLVGALQLPGPAHGFLDNLSHIHLNSNEALNLINTSQSPPSKLRSTLEGYMGIPNNTNELPMFPLNFSNNNGSHQINENDLTSASSNGGDDGDTTLDSKSESMLGFGEFDIKPAVVQFLVHKISNKNMLRIREELMNLKNADDYFKLTCVAPLAAGLLEQMFCRNQPKQESN